ncbi:MAG: MarR family transcriptional regulator [Promethearchaeota archaeon]
MNSTLLTTYISGLPRSRKVILNVLVKEGPLSPSEIIKRTEITKRTVLNSLNDLRERNLVDRAIVLEDLRKVKYYFVGSDATVTMILDQIRNELSRR